jgi:hypothetical protein
LVNLDHPLVICERDGGVALFRPEVRGWQRSLIVASGRWPTWNPTRDVIAVSVLDTSGPALRSSIELVDLDGRPVRTLYGSPSGVAPVIAPRVPHYALWSPEGDVVSYVARSSYGLTLFLADVGGALVADPIINGAPIFISWCNDNNFLAVHAGTELAVVETQGSRTTAEVAARSVGFRTPAFSDDADVLAYAVPAEPGVAVMRAHFQGTGSREVKRFPGGVALAFRPGTRELSVAVTKRPETGAFEELWSLDLNQEPPPARLIARGPFVAYWWAPTGDKIAVVAPTQSGDGRYAVRAIGADGSLVAAAEGIVPSRDFRAVLGFFDQYGRSHHLWAPDGRTFLLAGRLAGDGVSTSFGEPVGDMIFRWRVEPRSPLEPIAAGEIGFFPPSRLGVRG